MAMVDKRGLKKGQLRNRLGNYGRSNDNEKSGGTTAARCKAINLRFGVFIRLKKPGKRRPCKKRRMSNRTNRVGSRKTRYKVIVLLH